MFTGVEAADEMLDDLEGQPHAFVLACVMDRQMKAESAWRIPYEISKRLELGGFSFDDVRDLPLQRLPEAFTRPPALHHFPDQMGENAYLAIRRIADSYGGNAARIWLDTLSSAEVVLRFLGFRGVGPKIATMAANILARDFKIPFADYYSVDISADVHVRRVFTRLGLIAQGASAEEIIYRARALHPPLPGLMDLPTWEIGRRWCRPKQPNCADCCMQPARPTGTRAL